MSIEQNYRKLADFLDTLPPEKFDIGSWTTDGASSEESGNGQATIVEELYWAWMWCFDYKWKEVDNTPKGAALRIRHMLEFGVPKDANSQRRGECPYMFAPEGES